MINELSARELFPDIESRTVAAELILSEIYPWQAIPKIKEYIMTVIASLSAGEYEERGDGVYISKKAHVAASACIKGPTVIGDDSEIRHCAFIRGGAIIGKGVVIGNSVEIKNSIIFDMAQIPHFNYVGDSIIGYRAHLGAAALTSNVKSDKSPVCIRCSGERIETGFKKLGAILGNMAEIGAGSVLNPGTVIGRGASVYPLSSVRGYVPADSIYKNAGEIVPRY